MSNHLADMAFYVIFGSIIVGGIFCWFAFVMKTVYGFVLFLKNDVFGKKEAKQEEPRKFKKREPGHVSDAAFAPAQAAPAATAASAVATLSAMPAVFDDEPDAVDANEVRPDVSQNEPVQASLEDRLAAEFDAQQVTA